MSDLPELWRFRELLWTLLARDLTVRYRQTLLGVAWVVVRPLAGMAVFTVVFGRLAGLPSEGYPYPLFVLSALIPWTFFSSAVSAAGNSLTGSAGLIGKIHFPRIILPAASVCNALVDLLVTSIFLLCLLPLFGVPFGPGLALFPLALVPLLLLAFGLGTLSSALVVSYRDFGGLMAFLLQLWMYLTPVVYPASLVPPGWRRLLSLNPVAAQVDAFRAVFLGKPFDWASLAISTAVSAAIFLGGVAYFHRVERRFADVI
jgi:lipopolysaccharide transport system permease protein